MDNIIFNLINQINTDTIDDNRKSLLQPLCDYIRSKIKQKAEVNLNFICTHNSRRSQLSQVWAKVLSDFYRVDINTFSGGIKITACNKRTIASLKRMGFAILNPEGENPHFEIKYHENRPPIILFSKIYDDAPNPKKKFTAVMTCTHADEKCPFIPGAEKRISLPYEDPKFFDNSDQESEKYDERSMQIAREMKYIFNTILS